MNFISSLKGLYLFFLVFYQELFARANNLTGQLRSDDILVE